MHLLVTHFTQRHYPTSIGFVFNEGEGVGDAIDKQPYKIIIYCVTYDTHDESVILTASKSIHALRGELAYKLKEMLYAPADAVLRDYKIDCLLSKDYE